MSAMTQVSAALARAAAAGGPAPHPFSLSPGPSNVIDITDAEVNPVADG
eukprot:gene34502-61959_t